MTHAARRRRRWTLAAASLAALYGAACLLFDFSEPDVVFGTESLPALEPRWPAGFFWGTATSSHQVEGGNVANDWARFEEQPGRIKDGSRSGRASGHFERVLEDVALMKRLGANAYRFSIEWSRVEPREGEWDEPALGHYAGDAAALHAPRETPSR